MKRNWKNKMNIMLCSAVVTTSINALPYIGHTSVVALDADSQVICASQQEDQIMPYAEETTWYLRVVDGQLQKRLWSNTRGIWLTEWINCGVPPQN